MCSAAFVPSIIGRLVVLIATEATLLAESQAARRQAESATIAAQQMLNEKDNSKNDVSNSLSPFLLRKTYI